MLACRRDVGRGMRSRRGVPHSVEFCGFQTRFVRSNSVRHAIAGAGGLSARGRRRAERPFFLKLKAPSLFPAVDSPIAIVSTNRSSSLGVARPFAYTVNPLIKAL